MTGPWLVSYLVLWALVVAMGLLLIGVLRQIGLLYDAHGTLIRKGLVEGQEDLLALLGDTSVTVAAQAHVLPQRASSHVPAPLGASQR